MLLPTRTEKRVRSHKNQPSPEGWRTFHQQGGFQGFKTAGEKSPLQKTGLVLNPLRRPEVKTQGQMLCHSCEICVLPVIFQQWRYRRKHGLPPPGRRFRIKTVQKLAQKGIPLTGSFSLQGHFFQRVRSLVILRHCESSIPLTHKIKKAGTPGLFVSNLQTLTLSNLWKRRPFWERRSGLG